MEIGEFVLDVRVELVLKGASATSSYMTDGYIGPCTVGVHLLYLFPFVGHLTCFQFFLFLRVLQGTPCVHVL